MIIKQALKQKKKLIRQMEEELKKVRTCNSMVEGVVRPYSVRSALENWFKLSDELVALKAKLQKANLEVYPQIFLLAELKNQVSSLKKLDCREGRHVEHSYRDETDPNLTTVEVSVVEHYQMIQGLEAALRICKPHSTYLMPPGNSS
jgi:hypothetical protein